MLTHSNYTLADLIANPPKPGNDSATPGNTTAAPGPSSSASAGPSGEAASSGGSSKTGVIVGAVVGVIGGLLLAGLVAWFLLRRRRSSEPDDIDPYLISEKDLYRGPSWTGDEPAAAPAGSEDSRPRGPRIVQEEDADDVVEYLPPRYRERTEASSATPAPETPPLSSDTAENEALIQEAKPSLKEEYLKNLGIAPGGLPEGSSSGKRSEISASTPKRSSVPSTPILKRAYARLFREPEQAGSSPHKDWRDDVKHSDGL